MENFSWNKLTSLIIKRVLTFLLSRNYGSMNEKSFKNKLKNDLKTKSYLGQGGNVVGVVVEILVPLEQLLLPEALFAQIALEGLLVGVDQHVRLEVALTDRGVGAEVALEALLALVRLLVHLEWDPCIPSDLR